jgi:hypothetical protein
MLGRRQFDAIDFSQPRISEDSDRLAVQFFPTSLHQVNQKQKQFRVFKTGYFWGKVVPR